MAASRLRYLVEGTCYETSQLENLQLQSTIFSSHLHCPQPIALVDFLPTNQPPYLKALKRARSKQSKNIGHGSVRHLLLPRTVRSRRNNNSQNGTIGCWHVAHDVFRATVVPRFPSSCSSLSVIGLECSSSTRTLGRFANCSRLHSGTS
jgi:hypothetical protein